MFKCDIPLNTHFPENVIKNVTSGELQQINRDKTLVMTMITLLHSRVQNIKIKSKIFRMSRNTIEADSNPNVFSFYWFESSENPDDLFGMMTNSFQEIKTLTNIESFVTKVTGRKASIRVMPNENTVCIFVDQLTNDVWHLLISFIPKYFPVLKEIPLTEKEVEFLRSLTIKVPANYNRCLTELTETESFRKYLLAQQLVGFEKKIYQRRLDSAKTDLKSIESQMESIMRQYRELCEKRTDAMFRVDGIASLSEGIEERTDLQDYLVENKSLSNININNSVINFIVKGYLTPYHFDDWDNYQHRGRIFEGWHVYEFDDPENVKLLLNAIFSENHTLNLKICGYISMDYNGGFVTSQRNYDYVGTNPLLKNYIPNPHLNRHNCLGQNTTDVLELLKAGDVIGAIECCVSFVKRININEVDATFRPFINELLSSAAKCIVTPDGQEMTPCEALHYLKGLKNNETDQVHGTN